jgi:hypothetical protein
MKAKWEHFIQMQTYMHLQGLKFGLYCAVNKNDDDLYLEIVMPDPEQAKRTIERGRMIIYSKEAPPKINTSPGYWACKFCNFQKICHFKESKEVERNCRTCVFSEPAKDGSGLWECHAFEQNIPLNKEAQLKGCENYTISPGLFSKP